MNSGRFIHGCVVLFIMSLCFLPPTILRYVYVALILIPLHWWFSDGCFITKFHETDEEADFVLICLKWFDNDITLKNANAFTDIVLCSMLIFSTLRIMVYYGVYNN